MSIKPRDDCPREICPVGGLEVERLTPEHKVVGSNPILASIPELARRDI